LIVAPIVIVALLGWVLRDQQATTTELGIVNLAGAPGERVVDALTLATSGAPDGIEVIETDDSADAARARLRDGQIDVALILPATLTADVAAGRSPQLIVITRGTDPAAESGAFAGLQSLLPRVAAQLVPVGGGAPLVPAIQHETVYLSPDADQLDVLAPVFLGLFAYFFVFVLTGISFLRERVGGTLERLLATPVTRAEIVIGYSLGFTAFATVQVILLTAYVLGSVEVPTIGPLGAFSIGLGVQAAGSPVLTFVVALVLAIGAVNLGIFLSTFARTELQVVQFIPIVIVPQALLGGIFWPIDRLPGALQAIAHLMPVTYAVDALREVMLKGQDIASSSSLRLDLAVLIGVAVVFVVLAGLTIKREVA
ncbi:MAG TPA: ABC transporter permease, partial [Candidatus Limnocylindrales bacterium]|nr:ABC transporter permease [Candidatus Limnocylindrales bacterium]